MGCGGFRFVVVSFGWLWWVSVDCGRFQLVVAGFG